MLFRSSLLASVTVLGIALIYGHYGLAMITAPLAGALLAFLRYNFSPASVFLGDCGSLTIGFVLGCFGLVWSQQAHTVVGLAAPLMALALPLTDVGLAIGRRFLRNVPIFQADRDVQRIRGPVLVLEDEVLGIDVLDAAGHFAAERHRAVAAVHRALLDDDVLRRTV